MKSAEMHSKTNNITVVSENLLCCGCGACSAICNKQAISLNENPSGYLVADVDPKKCVNCKACLRVCPSFDCNQTIENIETMQGRYLAAYVGHAVDEQIRRTSQSGGVVTALLIYLLEKGDIKGAFVNTFDSNTKRPKVIFAQTKQEILASAGSYYSQSSVTSSVLEQNEEESAAVMLGCQAESLLLANESFPSFKKPKYIIGLVCAGQNSGLNVDYLLKAAGCYKKQIDSFRYRSKENGGWPGNVNIASENNQFSVSKDIRMLSKDIFGTYRCELCYDKANIYSDIVCGDPWGLHEYEEGKGNTIVLVRNQNGQQLITDAINDGVLCLSPLNTNDFFASIRLFDFVLNKCRSNNKYAALQGYKLPYKIDESFTAKGIVDTEVQEKVEYRRTFYSCTSDTLINNIINKKNREIKAKLFRLKIKRLKRLLSRITNKLRG